VQTGFFIALSTAKKALFFMKGGIYMAKTFPHSIIYDGVFYKANEIIKESKKKEKGDNNDARTTGKAESRDTKNGQQ